METLHVRRMGGGTLSSENFNIILKSISVDVRKLEYYQNP
jgi:hypothetical protein